MNIKTKRMMVIGFALIAVVVMILAITGLIEETLGVCIALGMTVIFTLIVALMAYKTDIKVLALLMSIFMIIGVILLGINVVALLTEKNGDTTRFTMRATEDASSKNSIFTYAGKNYYTYHLSAVEITLANSEKYSLAEAIQGGHLTLEEILALAIPNENTNGYKIYYDGGENGKDDKYSVVICESSNDVIFANYDYVYDASICG